MADETFTITYVGPAVTGGRMSVRDLAPALISLADAVREAHYLTHPGEAEPALDIQALRDGSFAVDLILSEGPGLLQSAIDVLSGREATAGANLAGLVGAVFGGFAVIKRLARRRIRSQEQLASGMIRLTFDDGQSITIRRESLQLAADKPFRDAARQVVAPMERDGVDTVELSSPREGTVEIVPADLPGFEVPPIEEQPLADQEREVALRPVNVAFTEGNKWRVSDGESTFFATVTDIAFLQRVETGQEVFAKSDILRARVRTRQWRTSDGDLRTDHEITQVLEHVAGPRQVPLPFEESPDDSAAGDDAPSYGDAYE